MWIGVLLLAGCVLGLSSTPPEMSYSPSRKSGLLTHSAEFYLSVPVDHYGDPSDTFQLRYIIKDDYYARGSTRPVFLYCGGAGSITEAFNRWDFLTTTLAAEHAALVVFAEHRFFGQSMPEVDDPYSSPTIDYLTPEQSLLDLTKLVAYIRTRYRADDSPFIAFGSGYSGLLAFWLRQKYPNYALAAVASSAPVLAFGDTSSAATNAVVSRISQEFSEVSTSCRLYVKNAFDTMNSHRRRTDSYADLSSSLGLCSPLTDEADVLSLIAEMEKAFAHLATFNYATSTNSLPANPVSTFCQTLEAQEIIEPGWWGGFTGSVAQIFGHLTDRQLSILSAVKTATEVIFANYDLVSSNSEGTACLEHRIKSIEN